MRAPFVCDRVRSQISFQLDGGLSQLERAMVERHLHRCGDCRAFRDDVTAFSLALREAPLERLEHPVVVGRLRRRALGFRIQTAAAAAAALVALGIGVELSATGEQPLPGRIPSEGTQVRFPSDRLLQQELALLELVGPGQALPNGSRATLR